jgi:hypothetical protein
MADFQEMTKAEDVAQALDWVRRRMKGKGLVLVAISPQAVVWSKEASVSAQDASELLEAQMPTLRRGFEQCKYLGVTRYWSKREDV